MKLILLAILASACACAESARTSAPVPPSPDPVQVVPQVQPHDTFVGVLAARQGAAVTATVSGEVAKVLVRPGQTVSRGDVVLRLDGPVARQHLAEARSAVETAEAQRSQASLSASEQRALHASELALYREGISARTSVRRAKFAMRKSEAAAREAAARVRQMRTRLRTVKNGMRLIAPTAGVVALGGTKPGDLLRENQIVSRIIDPEHMRVRFAVPPERTRDVQPGTRILLRLDSSNTEVPATVRSIEPEFETSLQIVVVEADVDRSATPAAAVQAGLIGRVTIVDRPPVPTPGPGSAPSPAETQPAPALPAGPVVKRLASAPKS